MSSLPLAAEDNQLAITNYELGILNKTRQRTPRGPFSDIKNSVLGQKYELSLVFIGQARSRTLNRTYRGKDNSTNVLSFELSKSSGEIFIDLVQAKKEYQKFDMKFDEFVLYLFIHGLLHLKGHSHGSTMEHEEKKLLSKFRINGAPTKSRD